ncbi:50S ribosomal protein L11 methyltransferase [Acidiferrimicrobium sp. IK]|uniref:50S ribosomal protein L11 methyltransferase n=1 Tax=Acidiferrimicrobium sp. IK TaxID=2871700 RepID=UPI0021CB78C0|nr:50S ribosomal protein L11 methyltransferase [Acidiferrimicrobium sp. IK]MCU4185975.1 50S ribosomal protein L11 methyltransferase [Acidiferrimicrobium sp. IK]
MPQDMVVELTVPEGVAELSADRLWGAGATAVGWQDRDGAVTLVASFPTSDAARTVAEELGAQLRAVDDSWRDVWKRYAEPVRVGGLVVAPAWRDVEVGGRLVVRIDPGWSFGSGTHPSTRLILAELDRHPPAGLRVLDVGCGSGILAVTAALLGAAAVDAVDIEVDAVAASTANADANGVGEKVRVSATPVGDLQGTWDLALVNVTAAVHATIGAHVAPLVRSAGRLLLAGLLPGQWRHVAGAYPGTAVVDRPELDGWEGVILIKA